MPDVRMFAPAPVPSFSTAGACPSGSGRGVDAPERSRRTDSATNSRSGIGGSPGKPILVFGDFDPGALGALAT